MRDCPLVMSLWLSMVYPSVWNQFFSWGYWAIDEFQLE